MLAAGDNGAWLSQLRVELLAAWAIAKKDVLIYYLKPNIIGSGMRFPLFMFLAFAVGRPGEPSVMIPGLIGVGTSTVVAYMISRVLF